MGIDKTEVRKRAEQSLPKERRNKGNIERLTEKMYTAAVANTYSITVHALNLKRINPFNSAGARIPAEDLKSAVRLGEELLELEKRWRAYTKSFVNISATYTETKAARLKAQRFLWKLKGCMDKMEALHQKPGIAEQQVFCNAYNTLKNIEAHYNEMTNGNLVVPEGTDCTVVPDEHLDATPDKESLSDIENMMAAEGLSTQQRFEDRSSEPLFMHEPCPDDIMQGFLGDCYYIASLSAIAATNPQYIKNMMRDNGNGTVTVKLDDGHDQPKYITVKKSAPIIEGVRQIPGKGPEVARTLEPFSRSCLWLQILEKALLAAGIHPKNARPDREVYHYTEIAHGQPTTGIDHVFGANNTHIQQYTSQSKISTDDFYKEIRDALARGDVLVGSTASRLRVPAELTAEYKKNLEIEKAINKKRAEYRKAQDQKEKPANQAPAAQNAAPEDPMEVPEDQMKYPELSKTNTAKITVKSDEQLWIAAGRRTCFGLAMKNTPKSKKGQPVFMDHMYSIVNAYEKDGEKYIVVRNPHASTYHYPDAESWKPEDDYPDRESGGYCVVPAKYFLKMFDYVDIAQPFPSEKHFEAVAGCRSITGKLMKGFEDARSNAARMTNGLTMSSDFADLYLAMKDATTMAADRLANNTALKDTFGRLEEKANRYLASRSQNSSRDNERNMRVALARASVQVAKMVQSMDKPSAKTIIRSVQETILVDRLTYALRDEKPLPAESYKKLAESLSDRDLSEAAFLADASELPGKLTRMTDAVRSGNPLYSSLLFAGLKGARTGSNSSEYNAIIQAARKLNENAGVKGIEFASGDEQRTYHLLQTWKAIDQYLVHKSRDGIAPNALRKLAVVESLNQYVTAQLQKQNAETRTAAGVKYGLFDTCNRFEAECRQMKKNEQVREPARQPLEKNDPAKSLAEKAGITEGDFPVIEAALSRIIRKATNSKVKAEKINDLKKLRNRLRPDPATKNAAAPAQARR